MTRLVAFYLPQFHPIPENDRWWGAGFTEWQTTMNGRPLFPGHYQPHLAGELGCYDLRRPDVRLRQAALAASHGIDAFCYYHYWFEGRRLLEAPFQQVLDSGEPAFPFCLCWANEPWTRRYDGRNRDVLMPQTYSPQDDLDHIRWLCGALADPRYVRVDGKAILLVYRGSALPSPARTIDTWRREAARLGAGDLMMCAVESNFREERVLDPVSAGFDAVVEFQPDIYAETRYRSLRAAAARCGAANVVRCLMRSSELRSYAHLVEAAVAQPPAGYRRFRCVTPGWDNAARRPHGGALVYAGSTPALYEHWLRTICEGETSSGRDGLVFVNAWNEWGEGCHLEPDERYGRAYLEATRRAAASARQNAAELS